MKCRFLGPSFDRVVLGCGLRIGLSDKVPGDADADGPRTMCCKSLPQGVSLPTGAELMPGSQCPFEQEGQARTPAMGKDLVTWPPLAAGRLGRVIHS